MSISLQFWGGRDGWNTFNTWWENLFRNHVPSYYERTLTIHSRIKFFPIEWEEGAVFVYFGKNIFAYPLCLLQLSCIRPEWITCMAFTTKNLCCGDIRGRYPLSKWEGGFNGRRGKSREKALAYKLRRVYASYGRKRTHRKKPPFLPVKWTWR